VASYIGDSNAVRSLLRNGALVDVQDYQGRLPMEIAILQSHVDGEESVAALLLKHGSPLSEELWHKLLIFSLDKDLVIYVRLAYERGIYLHNVDEEGKFSFHNAVCCNAKKVIAFLGETYGYQTMRRIGMTPDRRAMTAVDYANISEDKALQELVSQVIGDKLLQVKPKSLLEVEENLEREKHM
jgi:ankyrin repeat protein